ncbi:hypothetical protein B5V01_05995 [Mesorhizobium erdmanii]|uniref:DUF4145 domain-containing protein n=2 Tax=Mesorhizobium TaxID=68287 RepID=A0A3M9X952_9HYPH|nr:hypothetical protein DNR46_17505 [Mesorhizobium japonicum]RXT49446.1 hypothetical protein B5V01_05995 [Mesorhizobium erdmanii]
MRITTTVAASATGKHLGQVLSGVSRCPHCSIANPLLDVIWASRGPTARSDGRPGEYWATYRCTTCGAVSTVKASQVGTEFVIDRIFPSAKVAHDDLPEPARTFLQQAFETLHAPDAAAVMAGSAVDGFLKTKGYGKGSLYERIDLALSDNVLTKGMADWAHSVRLGSNRPRHADKEKPHISPEEAEQAVEFAEALGQFLFVLTARIERGIAAAAEAEKTT